MSSRKYMEELSIHSIRDMDTFMKKTLEDIQHWKTNGNLSGEEFFEHDIEFIKEILRSNNIAHSKKMNIDELLIAQHHLASTIILAMSMRSEDFPHLIQKSTPISEDDKKLDPLWAVQLFTNNEYIVGSMYQVPELQLRLVEADKITNPETVHKFIMQYASNVISSRIESDFLKRSLKHPSLREFFEGCYKSIVLDSPEKDSFMVDFQLEYEGIRLHVRTDGANYYIPNVLLAPQFTTLIGLLKWLKVAKQESDVRMSINQTHRLDSDNNPHYPYAVMGSEDVLLMKRNPFYSFKWFVESSWYSNENYTYSISQLAYRVHRKELVLHIPEMDELDEIEMVNAVDANIDAFREFAEHGYVLPGLFIETYVKDPVGGPFEETFDYSVMEEESLSDGQFYFSCDKTGFGEDYNIRVELEVEEVYPLKTFGELVDMINILVSNEIEKQK